MLKVITRSNRILKDYDIDIVCLAGYLKLYTPPPALARAVINIHPSLIPSFCGDGFYGHHVHEAIKPGAAPSAAVRCILPMKIMTKAPLSCKNAWNSAYEDDADTIADKVFAIECEAFPEAINRVDERGIEFFWKRVGL